MKSANRSSGGAGKLEVHDMLGRWRFFVLPAMGVIAAVVAFGLAHPFLGTLDQRNLPIGDPAASYSTGTLWDLVEHIAFGLLLCGSFSYALTAPQRGIKRGLVAALVGGLIGAVTVPIANSGADLFGIAIDRKMGMHTGIFGILMWCVVVPAAVAFTLVLAVGITPQRLFRAVVASGVGFFASLIAHFTIGPMVAILFAASNPPA